MTAPDDRHEQTTFPGPPEAAAVHSNGPLSIAVDFDGVLFDQVPHLITGFQDIYDIDLGPAGSWSWDLTEHPAVKAVGLNEREVWEVFRVIESDLDLHLCEPFDPDTVEVMERWRARGHKVHIVTSRRMHAEETTKAFLATNRVPFDELHMDIWPKVGYDVLIDDLPPNVRIAAREGSTALLFDRPYNTGYSADGNPRRVMDWREAEDAVETLTTSGQRTNGN